MQRIYIPTQEDIDSLPLARICTYCNKEKERSAFGYKRVENQSRVYWALRSACKRCEAIRHRDQAYRASERRIFAQIAPMAAAKKLLEQNPEALAMLIQRFRPQYIKLLEEERQRLITIKRNQQGNAKITHGKYEVELA